VDEGKVIEFIANDTQYRIRRMDSRNLILERKTPKGWKLEGYHNAYSLGRALYELALPDNIKGDLVSLFAKGFEVMESIERQIATRIS
jgi:hypothetical protein